MILNQNHDYLFKFLIIGDSNVGKSCLLMRFADDNFTDTYISTIGIDFSVRTIEHKKQVIKLQIWDCAGQERFRSIVASYYKGAHGVILAYSVADRNSFDNIKNWYADCKRYCNDNVNFIIVGTKKDLDKNRKVLYSEGEELAQNLGVKFMETSAKLNINVDKIFDELANSTVDMFVSTKVIEQIKPTKPTKLTPKNINKECCAIF